jgi:PPK2 family polyphosphate:nucleotide phosphotransferase
MLALFACATVSSLSEQAGRRTKMKYGNRFRVAPGSKVKLKDIDPGFKDHHKSHNEAAEELEKDWKKLCELQDLVYPDGRCSLLICLQGMDTAGKDGTINHFLGAMNPQGCRVVGFKQPTARELAHDFLWRIHQPVPAKGEVVIFTCSHYDDVLIVRVHNLIPQAVWSRRYDEINAFEKGLVEDNTHILKFYLHISKQEQLSRFAERLDDPAKQWNISESDYKERKFWDDYTAAYEELLSRCSTKQAPWFVIPSNHKWFRNLVIARIVVEHLEGLGMKFPPPSVDIEHIRREYHAAKEA